MEYIVLFAGPGIAICLYFFYRDIYNKEPGFNLLISFILGGIAIFPAILFESALGEKVIDGSISGVAVFSYLVVAFSEEGSKFLGFRLYSYNRKRFDEPFDGIIYAVIVSMGFATAENLKYLIESKAGTEFTLGIQRMLTAVPAHTTFGIIMGYFAGKAKFDSKNSFVLLVTGLAFAIIAHGTYDFFIFLPYYSFIGMEEGNQYLAYGGLASFVISIILCRKLVRRQRNLSREMFKPDNTTTSV